MQVCTEPRGYRCWKAFRNLRREDIQRDSVSWVAGRLGMCGKNAVKFAFASAVAICSLEPILEGGSPEARLSGLPLHAVSCDGSDPAQHSSSVAHNGHV